MNDSEYDYVGNVPNIGLPASDFNVQLTINPPIRTPNRLNYVKVNQRWWIEVKLRSQVDVAIAENALHGSPIRFIDFKSRYFLEDPSIRNNFQSHEVENHVNRFLPVLNSSIRLKCRNFEPMAVRCIIELDERLRLSKAMISVDRRAPTQDGLRETIEYLNSADPSSTGILNAARCNPRFEEALYFLGRDGESWVNLWSDLYKAFEIIASENGGERKICEMSWCSQRELTRFKRTANHPGGSGSGARHSAVASEPPDNPMSGREAQFFLLHLAHLWSESVGMSVQAR